MEKLRDQFQEFNSDPSRRRVYERQALALDASELIARLMDEHQVTKSELADMLGSSKPNVTSILSGSRNLTMHTLADVAFVLGHKVLLKSTPLTADASWEEIPDRVIECKFDPSRNAYEFRESVVSKTGVEVQGGDLPSRKCAGRAAVAYEAPEGNIQYA